MRHKMISTENILLVIVRHGESTTNVEKRYAGWSDVDLTEVGIQQAQLTAKILRQAGLVFENVFCSELLRARKTLGVIQSVYPKGIGTTNFSWRLNERHVGQLQGMSVQAIKDTYGAERYLRWLSCLDEAVPLLDESDSRHPRFNPKLSLIKEQLPAGESLRDTLKRVSPLLQGTILPLIKPGKPSLIVTHGMVSQLILAALEIEKLGAQIPNQIIPNALPILVRQNIHGKIEISVLFEDMREESLQAGTTLG